MADKKSKIFIFDTTLRDGEQSPGASLNIEEKLKFAEQLKKLKVNVIEAGFPISSPGDFESVKLIAQKIKGPEIAGLCRAMEKDIKCCYDAVKHSKKPRIHTFIATSDIHIKYKLKSTKEKVLKKAVSAVKYANSFVDNVEFSAEDASRTEPSYLAKVVESVIAAGAKVVNIPDTVGYAIPWEYGKLIRYLFENVKNINDAIISVHCHNDLGLATANALSAILNGVRQVECTINGIGERAGNAALEEIVMAINTRQDLMNYSTSIVTKNIYGASKLLTHLTGLKVQKNKAIVGDNAFAHEAGIHQDGVLKERTTYEIMNAQSIGRKNNELVLGKHSGRHAFAKKLKELGFTELAKSQIEKAFERFKILADKKKNVYDGDIEAIVKDEIFQIPEKYKIKYLTTTSGTSVIPTATVVLNIEGKKVVEEASTGDGPIDAALKAIDKIIKEKVTVVDYSLTALTSGKDAQGAASITIKTKLGKIKGRAVSTDVIESSVIAYLDSINRYAYKLKKNKK